MKYRITATTIHEFPNKETLERMLVMYRKSDWPEKELAGLLETGTAITRDILTTGEILSTTLRFEKLE